MELVEKHVTQKFLENETKSLKAVSQFVTLSAAFAVMQSSRVLYTTVTLNKLIPPQVNLLVHIGKFQSLVRSSPITCKVPTVVDVSCFELYKMLLLSVVSKNYVPGTNVMYLMPHFTISLSARKVKAFYFSKRPAPSGKVSLTGMEGRTPCQSEISHR